MGLILCRNKIGQCVRTSILVWTFWVVASLAAAAGDAATPGIQDNLIMLGQTATFSGPAAELGKEVRLGIEAAFNLINTNGGVHGRKIRLRSLDDKYEPDDAITNVRLLLDNFDIFALVGGIGTPTARAVAPIVDMAGVPYVAPFTGANFLRDRSRYSTIINLRTSYDQEIVELVERLTQDRGVSRIGILYQEDSFGRSGLESTERALRLYGLKIVGKGTFPRNTTAVKSAIFDLTVAEPEAVILIGAYRSLATVLKWSKAIKFKPVFVSISSVGSSSLAKSLAGGEYELYMTQSTPSFEDMTSDAVISYRQALDAVWPGTPSSYGSFEGFLAGMLVAEALGNCGRELTRNCFLEQFSQTAVFSVGEIDLVYGERDNQGLDDVYLTAFHSSGRFVPVRSLNDNVN